MSKFAAGKKALAICDRCGQEYLLKTLKPITLNDNETGLLVCEPCWEEDHPQNKFGKFKVYDPQALENPRPDKYPLSQATFIQWGWRPVGFNDPLDTTGLQNRLAAVSTVGSVSNTIT